MTLLLWTLAACGRFAPTAPRCEAIEREDAEVVRVDDDIYVVRAHVKKGRVPHKTITFIVTDEGVLAIDTGNPTSAEIARGFLREITDQPLKWIVYTHHHGTQTAGARQLAEEGTRFVAHEDFAVELERVHDLEEYTRRLNTIQFDLHFGEDAPESELPPMPDVTFADRHVIELGGQRIELFHEEGEARDYAVVWLPDRRYVWVGDLATDTFPMIASPMKPVREPLRWKEGLDRIAALDPLVMTNAVDPPICDRDEIQRQLGLNSAILQFVHDRVVEALSEGVPVEALVRTTELPPELADVWQRYGSLEFALRGVYDLYQGSYELDGSTLEPLLRGEIAESFVRSMGGRAAVEAKIAHHVAQGQRVLALQYVDLLLDAGVGAEAHATKSRLLGALANVPSENRIVGNMYRSLAREEYRRAHGTSGDPEEEEVELEEARAP